MRKCKRYAIAFWKLHELEEHTFSEFGCYCFYCCFGWYVLSIVLIKILSSIYKTTRIIFMKN